MVLSGFCYVDFSAVMDDELQYSGEPLTIEQAIVNLQGDDLGLRFYAAWWLGKFRIKDPTGTALLIQALQDEDDRTPEGGYPLRRNAARALGKIGDRAAVPSLIESLECSDYYVREAAANSLEMLQDDRAIEALSNLLEAGLESGDLHPDQPDSRHPYDAIIEALGTIGATAKIPVIEPFIKHPIERVQYAAARALYQLTQEDRYGKILVEALSGPNLQLRRAVLADLGAIGYLPAAIAITTTLAENSIKLASMKGLLEHQVRKHPEGALSDAAIQVMELMDSLL